jgi:ubiquinone/menaquinone biosynthesis C-methylase UbiE
MQSKSHWEKVYVSKGVNEVSWFQAHAQRSMKLLLEASIPHSAAIIDVGGGASTLVDDLLAHGYERLTILDLSGVALNMARQRLGARGEHVQWMEADILNAKLPEQHFDVWHDRAVFHFLTSSEDRKAYVQAVMRAVKPGGLVVVSTFAQDGPTECSGLPVMRYSASELHAEFGEPFVLLRHESEVHKTPGGHLQQFVYCLCRMGESVEDGGSR